MKKPKNHSFHNISNYSTFHSLSRSKQTPLKERSTKVLKQIADFTPKSKCIQEKPDKNSFHDYFKHR